MEIIVQTPLMEIGWFFLAMAIGAAIWSYLIPPSERPIKTRQLWRNCIPALPAALLLVVLGPIKYHSLGALEIATFVITSAVTLSGLLWAKNSLNAGGNFRSFFLQEAKAASLTKANWLCFVIFAGAMSIA